MGRAMRVGYPVRFAGPGRVLASPHHRRRRRRTVRPTFPHACQTHAVPQPVVISRFRSKPLVAAAALVAVITCYPAEAGEYSPEADLLNRINGLRQSAGVPALAPDRGLGKVAAGWAKEMAAAGILSHNPDLSTLVPPGSKVSENVGVGPSVTKVQEALERSESHRSNLVDPAARSVGIGVAYERGALWVVQDFKGPADDDVAVHPSPAPPTAQPEAAPPETRTVVFQSSFGDFSREGLAHGSQGWGPTKFAPVRKTPPDEGTAQFVEVSRGGSGGLWFDVPIEPSATYVQAVDVKVLALEPGARVEMILEWFDAASTLIGYRLLPIVDVDPKPRQLAEAPPNAASLRFVVNVAGGGSYRLDNATLEILGKPPR